MNLEILKSRWRDMKNRCQPTSKKYRARYWDRGITVCSEWQSFEAFARWAMKSGFEPDLELDRRDNDRGYSPSNCRFVTRLENTRNRDNANMRKAIRHAKTLRHAKPFICVETNQIFLTETSAARIMNLQRRNIGRVLKKVYKQVKGFTFKYIMIPLSMYDQLIQQEDAALTVQ